MNIWHSALKVSLHVKWILAFNSGLDCHHADQLSNKMPNPCPNNYIWWWVIMQNLKFNSTITYFSYIFVLHLTETICLTLSAAKLDSNHPASLTNKDIGNLFQYVSYQPAIYIIFSYYHRLICPFKYLYGWILIHLHHGYNLVNY